MNWIEFKAASVTYFNFLRWHLEVIWGAWMAEHQYKNKARLTSSFFFAFESSSSTSGTIHPCELFKGASGSGQKNFASTASSLSRTRWDILFFRIYDYSFYVLKWAHEILGSRAEQIRNQTWNLLDSTKVNVPQLPPTSTMIAVTVASQYLTLGSKLPIRQLHHGSRFYWTYSAVLPESNVLTGIWGLGVTSD